MSALHVHLFGPDDGRPVVALHGVTGHARRWAVLAEQLPELRLIAVDLRGHGHSPKTPAVGVRAARRRTSSPCWTTTASTAPR